MNNVLVMTIFKKYVYLVFCNMSEREICMSDVADRVASMAWTICSIGFDESTPYPTMTMPEMSDALARIDARISILWCKHMLRDSVGLRALLVACTRARNIMRKAINAGETRESITSRVCSALDKENLGSLLLAYIVRKELAMTSLVLS